MQDSSIKLLLIEDDVSLGNSLTEYLTEKGYSITWLTDEREFDLYSLAEFQAIILDLILNYISGEEILQKIRDQNPEIPVLVLTAKAEIRDKQTCFETGADDYLTKPFDPLELLLRIQALCKRIFPENTFVCGDVEINLDSQLIYKNNREIKLSGKAFELLRLLIYERGKLVSKEKILQQVWNDVVVNNDVIRQYIKEIRELLPEDSIETYKGRGYRLKA